MPTLAVSSIVLLLSAFHPYLPLDEEAHLVPGDSAFAQLDYPKAIREYENALAERSGDAVLLARLARVCVCMGEVEEDATKRSTALKRAESYARTCIALDPRRGEGHTWLAAALGYLALEAGMQEQIRLSRELLAEIDRALALNPKDDAALSIRGSFFHALGNVGWLKKQLAVLFVGEIPDGGFAEAEKSLLEAVALAPDIMRHRYELGILYMDMDRVSEACAALTQASCLPVRVAIDRPRLARIQKYLSDLGCKQEERK